YRSSRDYTVTATHTQEISSARQYAVWTNTDDFDGAKPRDRRAHSLSRLASGNRHAAGGAQDRIEDPVPVHAFIDDEPDRSRTSERENDRIDPGDVVRHKKEPARRQAIEAARGDPIKNRSKGKTDKTYEPF